MSKQIISSVMLEAGEIEAKVGNYKGGTTWLLLKSAGELQGFALHATPKQLEAIREALNIWSAESSRLDHFNISQLQPNGESSKT